MPDGQNISSDPLIVSCDARGVAELRLNQPGKHNALSAQLIEALTEAAADMGERGDVRVVVISANGKSFSAGGDLDWMRAQQAADRPTRIAEATRLAQMFRAINEIPKPVIARVHGSAFGGGVGLMCVSDLAIMSSTALAGLTEVRLGLIPATIGPYVVARIGEPTARRLCMSGVHISAEEAVSVGLAAEAVPPWQIDTAMENAVRPFLASSPEAMAASKALVRSLGPQITDAVIEDTIGRLADTWESGDADEGITAFLEKRAPAWIS